MYVLSESYSRQLELYTTPKGKFTFYSVQFNYSIGVGRFRILGVGKGGPNSQQAHDVVMTSMRRNDVA